MAGFRIIRFPSFLKSRSISFCDSLKKDKKCIDRSKSSCQIWQALSFVFPGFSIWYYTANGVVSSKLCYDIATATFHSGEEKRNENYCSNTCVRACIRAHAPCLRVHTRTGRTYIQADRGISLLERISAVRILFVRLYSKWKCLWNEAEKLDGKRRRRKLCFFFWRGISGYLFPRD